MSAGSRLFDHDEQLGPILMGGLFNFLLTGLYIVEAVRYFVNYRSDRKSFKALMTMMTILVFNNLLATGAIDYIFLVTNWGELVALLRPFPTWFSVVTSSGTFSATCCQSFLLWRIYKLAPSKTIAWGIIVPLSAVALAAFAGGLAVTIKRPKATTSLSYTLMDLWLICTALVDGLAACSLIYCFAKIKSQYTYTTLGFKRMIFRSIACGSWTVFHALLVLILYKAKPTAKHHLGAGACLAPTYALTLAISLGHRRVDPAAHAADDFSTNSVQSARSQLLGNVPNSTMVNLEEVRVEKVTEGPRQSMNGSERSFSVMPSEHPFSGLER